MMAYLTFLYVPFAADNLRWFSMPMVFGTSSLPYIGGMWLILVLPLFCLLPHRAPLWRWYFISPVLALVGFLMMSVLFKFDYNRTTIRVAKLAAIVGGATGLACSFTQHRLSKRPRGGTIIATPISQTI